MYVDTKICLTATLSLALRAFCVNRFAAFGGPTFQAFSLNTCVARGTIILFLTLLSSVASSSTNDLHIAGVLIPPQVFEPAPPVDPDIYIPPPDVRTELHLNPLIQLERERTPLAAEELIGVDWYSTGKPVLPEFEFTEPASRGHITVYYLLQALDVYSTYYATSRYKCVEEQNPLLPARPSVEQMMLLKLLPLYALHNDIRTVSDQELAQATGMMGMVVINNYEVIRSARKACP